jgi:hypothetical protein
VPRVTLNFVLFAIIAGHCYARAQDGTMIIYRQHGANFGFGHYAQGEHPTVVCDGISIAKMADGRKTTISVAAGAHICQAVERQYPGELEATSDRISIGVKANTKTYLRLECRFGHVRFVLREVPAEAGAVEAEKMRPIKEKDSYVSVLPSTEKGH